LQPLRSSSKIVPCDGSIVSLPASQPQEDLEVVEATSGYDDVPISPPGSPPHSRIDSPRVEPRELSAAVAVQAARRKQQAAHIVGSLRAEQSEQVLQNIVAVKFQSLYRNRQAKLHVARVRSAITLQGAFRSKRAVKAWQEARPGGQFLAIWGIREATPVAVEESNLNRVVVLNPADPELALAAPDPTEHATNAPEPTEHATDASGDISTSTAKAIATTACARATSSTSAKRRTSCVTRVRASKAYLLFMRGASIAISLLMQILPSLLWAYAALLIGAALLYWVESHHEIRVACASLAEENSLRLSMRLPLVSDSVCSSGVGG
jgi:hypothetical protein